MSGVDKQLMIDTAVSYFLAAERCFPDLEFGKYGSHSVCAPTVTNYAFAIEVALKLLLKMSELNKTRSGHDLLALYMGLVPKIRKLVRTNYPGASTRYTVFMSLKAVRSSFSDWRYAFEGGTLVASTTGMRRLFIACHHAIRTLDPDLKSIYEQKWGNFRPDPQWAWYEEEIKQLGLSQDTVS